MPEAKLKERSEADLPHKLHTPVDCLPLPQDIGRAIPGLSPQDRLPTAREHSRRRHEEGPAHEPLQDNTPKPEPQEKSETGHRNQSDPEPQHSHDPARRQSEAEQTSFITTRAWMAGVTVALAFDEPWEPHNAPPWFWPMVDQGNELQRQGIPGRDLADRIDQAIADTDDHCFTEAMDLIRNHLCPAWHIEQSFIDRAPRPVAGDPSDLSRAACRFVDQVVTTLYSTWLRDRTHREEVSATGRDARCARSRSPRTTAPQKHMDDAGGDASSLMDNSGGGGPLRKKSPTRLWKELPRERKSSEVRRLTPPWKKQNNPPFRPKEPREPNRSPPRTSPKPPPKPKPRPVPKCATDIPAPSTPTSEQPIPANDSLTRWPRRGPWTTTTRSPPGRRCSR